MLFAMLGIVALTAVAAIAIVSHRDALVAHPTRTGHAVNALDEAERILAQRYAHGEITAEEYDRMLVILRR
jgi:uncharacterized membrane protein